MKKSFIIKLLFLVGITWYVLMFLLPHNVYFHQAYSIFTFDLEMIASSLSSLGGFCLYIGAFISQFFYIPWLGSLIFALFLGFTYVVMDRVLMHFSGGKQDVFNMAIIPSVSQIVLFVSSEYSFEPIVAFITVMVLFWCWTKMKGYTALIFATTVTATTYPLIGLYSYLFIILLIVSLVLSKRFRLLYLIPITLSAVAPAFWVYPYFAAVSYGYYDILDSEGWKMLIAAVIYIILAITIVRINLFQKRQKLGFVISLVSIVLILFGGGYAFVKKYDVREKLMINIDKSISERDWDGVLAISKSYPGKNILITYSTNLAMLHKGTIIEQLFSIPQYLGVNGLFIGRNGGNRENQYIDHIYAAFGMYNEAHKQTWESMTTQGHNTTNLKKIVAYNTLMSRPKIAEKFDNRLKKTLFYRNFAETFNENNVYRKAIETSDSVAHFNNIGNIGADLAYLLKIEEGNKMATDYMMASLLLSNRVVLFGQMIDRVKRFYPAGNLPVIFQQALFILKMKLPDQDFAQFGVDLSPSVQQYYNRYMSAYRSSGGDLSKMSQFSDSYYYYLNFISPYGGKVSAK